MTRANMQLTDYDTVGPAPVDDLTQVAAPLSAVLTQELDGAAAVLGLTSDEILLAALGRAIQRTIGNGTVAVDIPGYGTSVHSVAVQCAAPELVAADDMLASVHRELERLSIHRMVHGVPNDTRAQALANVLFATGEVATSLAHLGHVLELRAHRVGDVMALDWWFDARSFEAYTVQELAEQLPLALIELTSEATPPILAIAELAMAH